MMQVVQVMRAIADNGGFVLAEDGPRLLFIERRGLVPAWAIFVAVLLAVILGAAAIGCVIAGVSHGGGMIVVGLGLAVVAALAAWGCVALVRHRRARRERPLSMAEAIVVLDREAGLLRDAGGRELARLDQVRIVRRFQATSSSRALHIAWPGGQRAVYRGDPFSGPIDDAVDQLEQRGIRVS